MPLALPHPKFKKRMPCQKVKIPCSDLCILLEPLYNAITIDEHHIETFFIQESVKYPKGQNCPGNG